VQVVVRPEQVSISSVGDERPAPANAVTGTVVSRSYFGHDGLVRVAVGAVVVACRTAAGELPPRGTEVHVWVTSPVMAFRAAD